MNQSQEHDQDWNANGGVDSKIQQVEGTRIGSRAVFSGADAASSRPSNGCLDLSGGKHGHEEVGEVKQSRSKNLF